jgi:glycogen operon protein
VTSGVNAVATHDGFTVADLVTYAEPVGGGHGQRSSNGGLEGPTADPEVSARRRRRQRALLGTVLCAQGVPMISAGDEIGRSQGGVADGYTLEPAEHGLPWPEADWDLAAWVATAVALRRRHGALRRAAWVAPDDPQISWLRADGTVLRDGAWTDPAEVGMAVLLGGPGVDDASALLLVAPTEPVAFALPEGPWWVVLDAVDARADRPAADPVEAMLWVEAPGFVVLVDRP